jgi:hypothetical protein
MCHTPARSLCLCYVKKQAVSQFRWFDAGFSLRILGFSPRWWLCIRWTKIFPCLSSFCHCSMFISHRCWKRVIALTRQHNVISSVLKYGVGNWSLWFFMNKQCEDKISSWLIKPLSVLNNLNLVIEVPTSSVLHTHYQSHHLMVWSLPHASGDPVKWWTVLTHCLHPADVTQRQWNCSVP